MTGFPSSLFVFQTRARQKPGTRPGSTAFHRLGLQIWQGEHRMGVPDSTVVVPSSPMAPAKRKCVLKGFFVVAVLIQLHYLFGEPSIAEPLHARGT